MTTTTTLPAAFDRYLPAIGAEMRAALGQDDALLYRMMRYHLGWQEADGRPSDAGAGKALRPVLCLLTCEALCGDYEPAVPGAAAIEILHNFSLVHDDIQDRDRTRRGRPTAWTIWGEAQAINAGDGLWALSTGTLLRAADRQEVTPRMVLRATAMLNDASLTMIEGQALDLAFETRTDVSTDEYLDMIARKTGALIARSIAIGAVFGGAEEAQLDAFERYGQLIGRIFQVRDDVLGIWGEEAVTGKSASSDIRRKKQTLPVIYALARGGPASQRLAAIYARSELSDADVAEAVACLDETGARAYADALARETFAAATDALADLPLLDRAGEDLDEMGRFLLERDR